MQYVIQKSYVQAHERKLKSGQIVQIQAHYDKRTKKHTEHAPEHRHDVSHLSSEEKDLFNRMHREQHFMAHYHSTGYRKMAQHHESRASELETEAVEHEKAGRKKRASKLRDSATKHREKATKYHDAAGKMDKIVQGIGALKEKLVAGSGKLADEDTNAAHARYAEKAGHKFKTLAPKQASDKPTESGHAEGDKWVMPLKAAVEEHKELVQAAETPTKADDKAQLAEQKAELARMEATPKDVPLGKPYRSFKEWYDDADMPERLPDGRWIDLETGLVFEGNSESEPPKSWVEKNRERRRAATLRAIEKIDEQKRKELNAAPLADLKSKIQRDADFRGERIARIGYGPHSAEYVRQVSVVAELGKEILSEIESAGDAGPRTNAAKAIKEKYLQYQELLKESDREQNKAWDKAKALGVLKDASEKIQAKNKPAAEGNSSALSDVQRKSIEQSNSAWEAWKSGVETPSRAAFREQARSGKLDHLYALAEEDKKRINAETEQRQAEAKQRQKARNDAWRERNLPRLAAAKKVSEDFERKQQAAKVAAVKERLDAEQAKKEAAAAAKKARNEQASNAAPAKRTLPKTGKVSNDDPSVWGSWLLGHEGESWAHVRTLAPAHLQDDYSAPPVVVQKVVAEQIQAKIDNSQPKDDGPKEGERNAEGLVFRAGRWHRDEEKVAPKEPVEVANDGLSDDPNSQNYRFKDTGYVAGSRKESASENIRRAARTGAQIRASQVDWDDIEKNPREAKELIKKSNLFGKVDWHSLRQGGMEPAAGFLVDRVYASVAQEPDADSPQKRKDYALGLESLRDRLEKCKTPLEVTDTLGEIRDELEGSILTEEQSAKYEQLIGAYQAKQKLVRQAKEEQDAHYAAWNRPQNELNSLSYEQDKRTRRGWKPDPLIQTQIEELKVQVEEKHQAYMKFREEHPELQSKKRDLGNGWSTYESDLEFEANQEYRKADAYVKAIRAQNLINNPVTRAWITLGPKFLGVLNYRRGNGSKSFAGHVTNARAGKVGDWSWAEKEGATVKRATKGEVSFQLKVAEKYERKGGRTVATNSTQAFKDAFGLREVQSGNWVLNDPNSAAWHVQKATEAFSDLADLLGVKDEHVSMNGRLAMAFGARGRGNAGFGGAARAHYEPVQRIINLTKMGGGGTLAHEWAHAMDNLCVEAEGGESTKDTFASESPELLPAGKLRDAFVEVRAAMLDGKVQAKQTLEYRGSDVKLADYNLNRNENMLVPVAKKIKEAGNAEAAVNAVDAYFGDMSKATPKRKKNANDWRRMALAYYDRNAEGGSVVVKAGPAMSEFAAGAADLDGGKSTPYWSQTHEMFARAFQAYCEDRLGEKGQQNDYLSVMADNKHYVDPLFGVEWKPFPEGEERKKINAAFDKLVAAIQEQGTLAKAAAIFAAPAKVRLVIRVRS